MKKSTLLIIALFTCAVIANAQKSKLHGSWLMTKAEVGGEIQSPYFVTEFKDDGNMLVMGIDAGTWEYNKSNNSIEMKSELDKDFNGEGKIITINEKELVVDKDGAKLFYKKVDIPEIIEANKNSGLMGMWEFKNETNADINTLLTFTEPDEFKMIQKEEGYVARLSGTWIFDNQEMSLIMIGLRGEDLLRGKSKVLKINADKLELESNGKVLKAQCKAQNAKKIERLTFTEDEFYNEDGDYKYYDEEAKLPWSNWDERKNGLLEINHLVYNYSTLIKDTEAFEPKILTADVKAALEDEGFNIDNIFVGYDRYNLPEDAEFSKNPEYSYPLYPLSEDTYRVVGNEQISTAAGTFDCTVVEAVFNSEVLKKLWMINGKPGVYAKIIEDNPDETWGHYSVYELQEIK